jgi:hypothetical protein
MKQNNHKRRKQRQPARREPTHKNNVARAPTPRLRVLSTANDDLVAADVSGRWFSERNARGPSRDADL